MAGSQVPSAPLVGQASEPPFSLVVRSAHGLLCCCTGSSISKLSPALLVGRVFLGIFCWWSGQAFACPSCWVGLPSPHSCPPLLLNLRSGHLLVGLSNPCSGHLLVEFAFGPPSCLTAFVTLLSALVVELALGPLNRIDDHANTMIADHTESTVEDHVGRSEIGPGPCYGIPNQENC